LLNTTALFADSVNTKERTVTKVAEGVYVIRHPDAPTGFPQSNTTVIIGEREVFVVDSCYLTSAAREDIAQIKQWTTKPVRYLLNTHWHGDHVMGNNTYWEAFPSLAIIAQAETQKQIEGYLSTTIARYLKTTADLQQRLETGKGADGKPLTEAEKTDLAKTIANREQVMADWKNFAHRVPNVAFDRELNIDIGNRAVQIKFLGRGNTNGDAVVYLPKEKILVAGDLLDHPVPYLGGGFPSELIATLQRMAELDTEIIVPGHGEVLRGNYGKTYLKQVIDFVQAIVAQVKKEVYRLGNSPLNLEAVQKAVLEAIDVAAWRQKFAGDDKDNRDFFDSFSLPGVIRAAYREDWGN
jgi:glyoxylase-like metal-dependent hydrolase (beta-lactamase superfamily II)